MMLRSPLVASVNIVRVAAVRKVAVRESVVATIVASACGAMPPCVA